MTRALIYGQTNYPLATLERFSAIRYCRKQRVIDYYSKGDMACVCCNDPNLKILVIDHINGGGAKQKKLIGKEFYLWLIENNYPRGMQVLCRLCNNSKRDHKTCQRHILSQTGNLLINIEKD